MSKPNANSVGRWLSEVCRQERLSLRQAAAKTGLSHATISDIIKGSRPTPGTIKKLAAAFSNGHDKSNKGAFKTVALQDKLLILAGYRTPTPEREISEPMARLLDKLAEFSQPQLKVMSRFADFISELEIINEAEIAHCNSSHQVSL